MLEKWQHIKVLLSKEHKETFENANLLSNCSFEEILDVFYQFLIHKTNYADLSSLAKGILNPLEDCYNEDLPVSKSRSSLTTLSTNIEPFLKKLLSIIDSNELNRLLNPPRQRNSRRSRPRTGITWYANALYLNKDNINWNPQQLAEDYKNGTLPCTFITKHLVCTYLTRNEESHAIYELKGQKVFEYRDSISITLLYSIIEHYTILKNYLEDSHKIKRVLKPYFKSLVDDHGHWQQSFVHINGKRVWKNMNLQLKRIHTNNTPQTQQNLEEGTIKELRKVFSKMVLLGDAGLGKTTTMQFLTYEDAKLLLSNPEQQINIPIYVELKYLQEESIQQAIFEELKNYIGKEEIEELLTQGNVSILLDGLNEITSSQKEKRIKELHKFLRKYPKSDIIVSTRPLDYHGNFRATIPFALQPLSDERIKEFLNKNASKETQSIIKQRVITNPRLEKVIRSPFILTKLILVVEEDGEIPTSETFLIHKFIEKLYEWQNEKDISFNNYVTHQLLSSLALKIQEKYETNKGVKQNDIMGIWRVKEQDSFFLSKTLKTVIELNILVKKGNKYSFTHHIYQEYFAQEAYKEVKL